MTISIIKIPFDACIVEKDRRGAAKGPDAIESELRNFFQFEDVKKNIEFSEIKEKNDFEKMHTEAESIADKSYKNKNFVIGLGGDHSVSYGLMKAFAKNHKNAGLIYFDAHFDCQDDFIPPTHEDILRAVIKEKLFKHIFVYGVRNYTDKEMKFAGLNVTWGAAELPIQTAKEQIMEFVDGIDNIYISIDIDVIDAAFAPGTGWPEPLGILPQQLAELLTKLKASGKVKGIDLVEVSPPKDTNNITARLAASLLLRFLR